MDRTGEKREESLKTYLPKLRKFLTQSSRLWSLTSFLNLLFWEYSCFTVLLASVYRKVNQLYINMHWLFFQCLFAYQFSSVQFSCSVVSNSSRPHELQHARPPCPSPTPGAYSDSHPSSRWCHPAISSSVPITLICGIKKGGTDEPSFRLKPRGRPGLRPLLSLRVLHPPPSLWLDWRAQPKDGSLPELAHSFTGTALFPCLESDLLPFCLPNLYHLSLFSP